MQKLKQCFDALALKLYPYLGWDVTVPAVVAVILLTLFIHG